MNRLIFLILSVFIAGLAIADPNGGCNFKTGSPGCVAYTGKGLTLATQGPQDITFKTNDISRGTINGTTGAWTGLTFGDTILGDITVGDIIAEDITLSGGMTIANATPLNWRNAANDANIEALLVDASDETLLKSDSGDSILLKPSNDTNRTITIGAASDAAHTITYGDGGTTAAQTLLISASTADADDDSRMSITGGGTALNSRGAFLDLYGNEATGGNAGFAQLSSGAGTNGDLYLTAAGASNSLYFRAGGTTNIWRISSDALLAQQTTNAITAGTADASDIQAIYLGGGGGGTSTATARGSFIGVFGNEHANAGKLDLATGNASGAAIRSYVGGTLIQTVNSTGPKYDVATYTVASNTSDAADSSIMQLGGGGACAASRGGCVVVGGNEASGGGYVQLYGGNTATGDVALLLNNASADIKFYNNTTAVMWNMDNNGLLTSTSQVANDIGWTPIAAADQACNTTCAASGCVFGFNLTAGVPGTMLLCTDATADVCLCAGAS